VLAFPDLNSLSSGPASLLAIFLGLLAAFLGRVMVWVINFSLPVAVLTDMRRPFCRGGVGRWS